MKMERTMKIRTRLNEVKSLIETTERIKELIDGGFVTGSYAWNLDKNGSDVDIVLKPYIGFEIQEVVSHHNGIYLHSVDSLDLHYLEDDFNSCYVLYDSIVYNLLFMNSYDAYMKWVYATVEMRIKCKNRDFYEKSKDKEFRVREFEKLKEEYVEYVVQSSILRT